MTAEQKRLERLHILATLAQRGPLTGVDIVTIANSNCVDERFDAVPDLTNRGIGAKMNAISLTAFVKGERPTFRARSVWSITDRGRDHLRENGVEV